VFDDPLSLTISDPLHSEYEERFIITGESNKGRLLVVVHVDRGYNVRIITARLATSHARMHYMKKATKPRRDPDMLDEYDFSKGVRGKYVKRFAKGSNVVVLSPDVAEVFKDSDSVNEILRALVKIVRKKSPKKAVA
jgi:hypothetical protein